MVCNGIYGHGSIPITTKIDAKPTFNEGGKAATNCGGGIFYGFESISGMEASKKNQVLGESMKQKL